MAAAALADPFKTSLGDEGGQAPADALSICRMEHGRGRPFEVVRGKIPADLSNQLARPFTEPERRELFRRCGLAGAERVLEPRRPKALWIFGPPAVGKSTLAEMACVELFGAPCNAVLVDGDDMREVHAGFQKVADHGCRHEVVHADAWEIFKKAKITDSLKNEVLRTAIGNRQNLLIPDAAVSLERSRKMLGELVEAGYDLFAVCMWAPEAQTQVRGAARAEKTGKVFNPKTYVPAIHGALEMGRHWHAMLQEGSECYSAVAFYDSTVRPSRPVDLAQFELLARMTQSEAAAHAELCEAAARDGRANPAAEETLRGAFLQAGLPGCGVSRQASCGSVGRQLSCGGVSRQASCGSVGRQLSCGGVSLQMSRKSSGNSSCSQPWPASVQKASSITARTKARRSTMPTLPSRARC